MTPKLSAETTRGRVEGILAAAVRCFVEKGYDRATLREVARGAGVSTGAVYAHFGTKAELLLEVCRRQGEAQSDALREALSFSPEDGGFEAAFEAALRPFLTLPEREARRREMVNLLFWYESVREPSLGALMREAIGGWRGMVIERVQDEQESGRLREDLDPEAFAAMLFALPFGLQLYELLSGKSTDREAFVKNVAAVLERGTR